MELYKKNLQEEDEESIARYINGLHCILQIQDGLAMVLDLMDEASLCIEGRREV
jgi:hypothetical protein